MRISVAFYLEGRQAIESCGVNCFRGDIGDVCYKLLQIPAGLLQVCGVNDDLHQLQRQSYSFKLKDRILYHDCMCVRCSNLGQSYVGLLDEVLQAAAESSRQQKVG